MITETGNTNTDNINTQHATRDTQHAIRLLILDGDHTLWDPVDGVCCSDRDADDREGRADFTYRPDPADPDRIIREDGIRFALNPGARELIAAVHAAGGACAVCSFNYAGNIARALTAWGLREQFAQIVAHWHARKREMLLEILEREAARGHAVRPAEALFVDDDPYGTYGRYAADLGIRFLKMGVDIRSFAEVLPAVRLV